MFTMSPGKKELKDRGQASLKTQKKWELTIAQCAETHFLKAIPSLKAVADGRVFMSRSAKAPLFIHLIIPME